MFHFYCKGKCLLLKVARTMNTASEYINICQKNVYMIVMGAIGETGSGKC